MTEEKSLKEKQDTVLDYCGSIRCSDCVLWDRDWSTKSVERDCLLISKTPEWELDKAIELISKNQKESEEQNMEQSYPTLESLIGKVVEFEGGVKSIVVSYKNEVIAFRSGWMSLTNNLDDRLICKRNHCYTINKIYEPARCASIAFVASNAYEIIWQREPEVKEVTMAEVEEKFGCKVKIINNEQN